MLFVIIALPVLLLLGNALVTVLDVRRERADARYYAELKAARPNSVPAEDKKRAAD